MKKRNKMNEKYMKNKLTFVLCAETLKLHLTLVVNRRCRIIGSFAQWLSIIGGCFCFLIFSVTLFLVK